MGSLLIIALSSTITTSDGHKRRGNSPLFYEHEKIQKEAELSCIKFKNRV